jgi:hypothetical protein
MFIVLYSFGSQIREGQQRKEGEKRKTKERKESSRGKSHRHTREFVLKGNREGGEKQRARDEGRERETRERRSYNTSL